MKRVLIADDKEENLYYLEALLTAEGFQVESAQHGAEALVRARQRPPDLIISDLLMPVMDGYSLLRHWRGDARLSEVPFIVYTATYTEPEDEQLALRLGADAFILKPADPDEFLARLREVISAEPTARSAMPPLMVSGETAMLQSYSETLIRKLEQKTMQLQETNRALQEDITARRRTEAALQASEAQFAGAFVHAAVGMALVAPDGSYLKVNRALCEMIGYSEKELLGMRYQDVTHPDDLDDHGALGRLLTGEVESIEVEKRYLHREGRIVWGRLNVSLLRDENGAPVHFIAQIQDITARRESKEATERALQRLYEAQRIGQIGDWEWLPESESITWSPQVYEIIGRDPSLGPPQSYEEYTAIFDAENSAHIRATVDAALHSGEPQTHDLTLVRADGRRVELRGVVVPRKDESGRVVNLHGTVQDITASRAIEAALSGSEQRYRDLFKHMLEGYAYCRAIFEADRLVDFVYLEVNDAFEKLTGLTGVVGRKISEVIPDEDSRSEAAMQIYERAIVTGAPERCELFVEALDAWLALAVYSSDHEHFVVVFDNISERKRTEEALRRSEALFRTLVQTSWDAFHLIDPTGRITFETPAVTRVLGYTAEEMIGRNVLEFIHPQDAAGDLANGQDIDRGPGQLRHLTQRVRHKDGSWRWIESYDVNLIDHPDVGAIAVNYRDITQRVDAESSVRRLAAIVEYSADAIIGKDTNSIITSWNRGAETVFGYTASEMVGTSIMRLIPPDRHADEHLIISTILRGESVEHFETRRLTKDGRLIDVAVTVSPIKDREGKVVGASKVARDITARKEAEASAKNLLTVLEASLNEIFIFDAETKHFEYVNDAALRNLGYTMEQMRTLRPVDITPEFTPESFAGMTDPLRFHQEPKLVFESEHRRADGTVYPIEAHMQFVERLERDVFLVVGNDISERRRAELRIAEQASLINQSRDAIFVRDTDHKIAFWSKGAERVYGWTMVEALGRPVDELIAPDPEASRIALEAVFALGEWNGEIAKLTKSGDKLTVESRWTLLRDDGGKVKSILVIDTDVTERKKLEQQFFRAQRLESIGTLASGLAHDLNNILAPILMCAPLLRRKPPAERSERLIATIEASAARGAQIISQVLTFGLGTEGERQPLQLADVIGEVVQIARETFPKNVRIESCVATNLSEMIGDATQWHQVLLNLFVNARDAMAGGGELRITAENLQVDAHYASMIAGLAEGPHIVVSVEDTGCGIPPEIAERIFDPFFTTKAVGKGSGLGLSTALGIVKSHGAVINLKTPSRGGTTFQIIIPADAASTTGLEYSAPATVSPGGAGELILIIEDEENVRHAVQYVLEMHGYRTLLATDGTDGLALFAQHAPGIHAVLTDINMPHMNGVTLTRALRRMQPGLPIVASSGQAESTHLAELKSLGIDSLLKKPYSADLLLCTLESALKSEG